MEKRAAVKLKKGSGKTLKSGGLWVYDNEIAQVTGEFENGALVDVLDFDEYFLGVGFINTASKIRPFATKYPNVVDDIGKQYCSNPSDDITYHFI